MGLSRASWRAASRRERSWAGRRAVAEAIDSDLDDSEDGDGVAEVREENWDVSSRSWASRESVRVVGVLEADFERVLLRRRLKSRSSCFFLAFRDVFVEIDFA